MDIKDLKQAEELLIESTQNDNIKDFIEDHVESWDLNKTDDYLFIIAEIRELFHKLYAEIFDTEQDDTNNEALHWIVFNKIHDIFLPCIRVQFSDEDIIFFDKCKLLSDINVSAEQFGADENYSIPLTAAIVELSVLDKYKSPVEKMNCLCSTYDLVFAEIKTAMVSMISQNSEKENEIPIIDNRDIIPVLMVVIIKSKLVHLWSNLYYIKSFYYKMEVKRITCEIFKSFELATKKLMKMDVESLQPVSGKIIRSIDLEEYIRITSCTNEETENKTLVDEANLRVLNLITRSTSEDQLY